MTDARTFAAALEASTDLFPSTLDDARAELAALPWRLQVLHDEIERCACAETVATIETAIAALTARGAQIEGVLGLRRVDVSGEQLAAVAHLLPVDSSKPAAN